MNTVDIIRRFSKKQKTGWHLCPRCGMDRMNIDTARNALSRRADIMICDTCGGMEAIEDASGRKTDLERWALLENPDRFFLKNTDYKVFYITFGSWEGFPFQNAYIVVQGFDRNDAYERFRRVFPDKTPGIACYAFDYAEDQWTKTESSKNLPCAGVLYLNDWFEESK